MATDHTRLRLGALLSVAALSAVALCRAAAQDSASAPEPAEPARADVPDGGKTLDELLGLDEEGSQRSADAARRDSREELERALAGRQMADALGVALEKMHITADLLEGELDPGLGTQRLQEEILAKLQELIDQAGRLQSSSQGGGGGGGGSAAASRSTPPSRPGGRTGGSRRNDNPSNSGEGSPPPRQEGDVHKVLEESRTEWGHLPQRVREMLQQGSTDVYSSLYRRLTIEYYLRLAEQGQ